VITRLEVAMAAAVPLRSDFDAAQLRALAKRSRDPDQTRRLLALAAIYDGSSRTEAAQIGCVTLQIVRDWVLRFNARGPEGLLTGRAPGAPPRLTDQHRQALTAIVEQGPIPAIHGVVRWRLVDLIQWLWEEYRLSISKQTLSRELRALNYRKLSARPRHHAKSEAAVAAFKKTFPPAWRKSHKRLMASRSRSGSRMRPGSGRRTRLVPAQAGITRRWAKRGTRPSAPKDQRTASAYIFGAICPAHGKGAGLVLPRCTTQGMTLHLNEISQAVAPGAHALVLVDRAGWHQSKRLVVPDNITLVPLPSKAPELNPVENVWQYMRENWISNRIFTSYPDIVRHITRRWIPFAERRGLEDVTPGPTAYPAAKAKGDRSMPSKRERSEDADDPVPQGPRDTVRTELFEPQPPTMQGYIPRHSVLRRGHRDRATRMSSLEPSTRWAMGHRPIQGGERGTSVALDTSSTAGMWDRPTRREAQGDGAAVVLRGRESRPHGEGRQVS
jgi:putative transposase